MQRQQRLRQQLRPDVTGLENGPGRLPLLSAPPIPPPSAPSGAFCSFPRAGNHLLRYDSSFISLPHPSRHRLRQRPDWDRAPGVPAPDWCGLLPANPAAPPLAQPPADAAASQRYLFSCFWHIFMLLLSGRGFQIEGESCKCVLRGPRIKEMDLNR